MSVSTKSFRQVLYGAAKRVGMVPEQDGLQRTEAAMLTEFLNSAVKLAWEFYTWPDALQIRQESIIAHPTVTGAKYVPRSNNDRTLKVITALWDTDPRVNRSAHSVFHTSQTDGLYFYNYSSSTVWVQYRPEPPEYTDEEWSATRAYTAGAIVWDAALDASGHVFRALQYVAAGTMLTNTAHWEQVPVLACIAEAVKAGIVGAWNASENQHGTARVKQEYMLELLEHEILQIQNQGQQTFAHH